MDGFIENKIHVYDKVQRFTINENGMLKLNPQLQTKHLKVSLRT